ncbi:ABC transporter ATP-binding protein [Pseudomonadota bacterium]
MSAIDIKMLSKCYGKHLVLDNVSMRLEAGKAIGILGENGAGKSTLIKCILKLVYPDAGHVNTTACREEIAYLPEQSYLPESVNGVNMVRFAASFTKTQDEACSALDRVGLRKEAWNQPVRSYSKGMRQRTAIAMMLVRHPRWLILDEPMSGLDAIGRRQMLDLFQNEHQQGCSILMSSHHVADMVRFCDEIIILSAGKVRESITIESRSIDQIERLEQKLTNYARSTE